MSGRKVSGGTKDPFSNLKYLGYCMAKMPPEGTDMSMEGYVNWCKFQLCCERGLLMNDPVWDEYSSDGSEIIVEYFGVLYYKNEEEADKFKNMMEEGLEKYDSDMDFFERMLEKNKKDRDKTKETIEEQEDSMSFSPKDVL